MRVVRIIAVLFFITGSLSACLNKPESDESGTTTQSSKVSIDIAPNGCLRSDNAEARTEFLMGSQLVKMLVWNCAQYNGTQKEFVEMFAAYSTSDACYRIQGEYYSNNALCGSPASPVSSPAAKAAFARIGCVNGATNAETFQIQYWGATVINVDGVPTNQYTYGFCLSLEVNNTGNVSLYGLSVSVSSPELNYSNGYRMSPGHSLASAENYYLDTLWTPGRSDPADGRFTVTGNPLSSGFYSVTFILRDMFGNPLDTKTRNFYLQ